MKRLIITLVSIAATTAAVAECDFPYYPEYADAFSKYDEVTPLLAKKVVMGTRIPFAPAGAIVCEPLGIRDIAGTPLGFVVPTYNGTDLKAVKKWNAIANKINNGQKIPAKELKDEISFFYKKEYLDEFTTAVIHPYTFHSMIPGGSGTFPDVFAGYSTALKMASAELATDDAYFRRIVGGGLYRVQSFEFEDGNENVIIIGYDKNGDVDIVDPEVEKEGMRKVAEISFNSIKKLEASGKIERNIQRWKDKDGAISDYDAAQEYATIINRLTDYDDDLNGYYLDKVPDVNQSLGKWHDSCWCYGIGAVFAYHGMRGVAYTNLKSERPEFDDGTSPSSPTQKFAIEISNTYHDYVNTSEAVKEYKDFYKLAVRALEWAYEHGCSTPTRKLMFVSWAETIGSGPSYGGEIYNYDCWVPWGDILTIVSEKQPITLGDEWMYGREPKDAHTCPCIGWAIVSEYSLNDNVYYDMNPDPLEPNGGWYYPVFRFHWLTWYQEEEEYPYNTGVQMTPPGPGIQPASWVTYVKAARGEEDDITWGIFKSEDVKGFNLYAGTAAELGPALNGELIPAEGGKIDEISTAGFELITFGTDGGAAFTLDAEGFLTAYNTRDLNVAWREKRFSEQDGIHFLKYNEK